MFSVARDAGVPFSSRAAALRAPLSLVVALLLSTATSGCLVKKSLYDSSLDSLAAARATEGELREALAACEGDRSALQSSLASSEEATGLCMDEKSALALERDNLVATVSVLNSQLDKAGSKARSLADAKGAAEDMLAEARAALADARARQEAAEAQGRIFKALRERLKAMIDAGKLNVRIERGRMVIGLRQDVLFSSGKAELSEEGVATISEVGEALAAIDGRSFQVEGHTDNVPIKTTRFPSNWELSTARAVEVVKLMVSRGLPADQVSAAGYGENQPRASNDEPEGRALNRRIEIVMLPDLAPLPDMVDGL